MSKGKLIVFEGADGSGKTTQSKLLLNYFKENKIPAKYISFPRYDDSLWGAMVRRFLRGDFGRLAEVDPYFASCLYAGDRAAASGQLKKWLLGGYTVVCNRYIGSNIGHMAAKFKSQSERTRYIKWLEDLEYRENGIPREDLVIFLHVAVSVSQDLMKGRKLDIHERDLKYLAKVTEVYEAVTRSKKNWVKVDCTKGGQILKPEEIHKKVLAVLKKLGNND